jgi:hypothetical protein
MPTCGGAAGAQVSRVGVAGRRSGGLVATLALGCAARVAAGATVSVETESPESRAVARSGSAILTTTDDLLAVTALDADDDGVYFAGPRRDDVRSGSAIPRRNVMRVAAGPNAVVRDLWEGDGEPYLITAASSDLYFQTNDHDLGRAGTLYRMPKSGGTPSELASFRGHAKVVSVLVRNGSLYYSSVFDNTAGGFGNIGRVLLPRGSLEMLVSDTPSGPLALAGRDLVWLATDGLHRVAASGGRPMTLLPSGGESLRRIVAPASERALYLAAEDRIVKFDQGMQSDFVVGQPRIGFMLTDGAFIYWSAGDARTTQILKVSLRNREITVIAQGETVSALALDRTRIYWIDPLHRTIKFAPR